MKILRLCVVAFLLSGQANGQTAIAQLPPAIRTLLDQKFPAYPAEGFPGGRLAEVSERESQWLKDNGLNTEHPAFVTGDFDDNGKEDYGVLVLYGDQNAFVVALLGQDIGYNLVDLHPGGCGECYKFLTVGLKGDTRYDWETGKSFVYQRDTLEAWGFNHEGHAFTNLIKETYGWTTIMRFLASDTILGQLNAATLQAWSTGYRGKTFTGMITFNHDAGKDIILESGKSRHTIMARLQPGLSVKLTDGTIHQVKHSDIPLAKVITIYYTEKESKDALGNKVKIREIVGIRFPATGK